MAEDRPFNLIGKSAPMVDSWRKVTGQGPYTDDIKLPGMSGIELLAKHRIKEGMPLCIQIMEIHKWGKKKRITRCLETLRTYGAAAKAVLPQLRQLEKDLLAHREARMLRPMIEQTQALIKDIENATGTVDLRSIDDR